jgi:predicted dehydrogenase
MGVEMGAVCDVYEPNLQGGLKAASTGAKSYTNYKRLVEDKFLDAVVIATPDHWHCRMAADAVEAGKDVYVEKPMAHTVADGFMLIEATRRTRRVVQIGTQRRSFDLFQEGKRIMDSGALGPVRMVNSWWLNRMQPRKDKLEGVLDWEQWLGYKPKTDPDPAVFFNWHYIWNYGGGMLSGQGAHVLDAINWFMNSTFPVSVVATGIRPMLKGHEAPDVASMLVEYPGYLAIFTLNYQGMVYNMFNDQMTQFHGSKARFDVGRESYTLLPQTNEVEMKPSKELKKPGGFAAAPRAHIRNFMDCIRSRKDPNAPVEAGMYTSVALLMAKDSLRNGGRARWDGANKRITA